MSINSNIAFKILRIHFVPVALMLKQIRIFFFTAPCLLIKDAPSWAQLKILIVLWQILMIRYWLIFFFLVKLLLISLQTSSYLMQQRNISCQQTDFKKIFFLIFCNFLLYFYLFNFFPYPYVFIWDYTFILIWLLGLLLFIYQHYFSFLHSLFGYT